MCAACGTYWLERKTEENEDDFIDEQTTLAFISDYEWTHEHIMWL